MQHRNQQNPKASWRKSTRQAAPGATTTPEFGARGRSRRKLLFQVSALATLAVGLTAMLVIVWLRKPDRDVPLIVAAVTRSSDDCFVPISPFALEDVQLWKKWFAADTDDELDNQQVAFQGEVHESTGEMVDIASGSTTAGGLISQLTTQGISRAVPGGPKDDMLALCVITQGLVDQNQPYLIVGNSRPEDKATWILVEDLFKAIHTELEQKDWRAVLFLDANRAGTVWDWGKLDNSFTSHCQQVAGEYEDRLAVIVSCQDGQRSWWDPNQGHSLFARAMLQSFAGDEAVDQDGGGISVGEIENFLRTQVASDAARTWDAAQHPKLLTESCRDWSFIATPDWPENIKEESNAVYIETMRNRFAAIDELWRRHNDVREKTHSPLVTDPLQWSILEKRLARLDQLALAGSGSAADFAKTLAVCKNLLNRFERGPVAVRSESFPELALAEYFHTLSASDDENFQQTFDEWAVKADLKADPFDMKDDEDREVKLTSALWQWLLSDKQYPDASVGIADALLVQNHVGHHSEAPVRFLESHLIRLLSAPDLGHVGLADSDRVLRLHNQSRQVAFPSDVRASFWMRHRTAGFDSDRMILIDRILGQRSTTGMEDSLAGIEKAAEKLILRASEISDAYLLRDQLLHEIPRISETLLGDDTGFADNGERIAGLLRAATEATRQLEQQLRLSEVATRRWQAESAK